MKYYSTRNASLRFSLKQAAINGLAPCGGLFMPEQIPLIDLTKMHLEAERSFAHMAYYVASKLFEGEIEEDRLREIVFDAFDFEIPLHRFAESDLFTLELFHGPTLAFKDFGARFLGRMLPELMGGGELNILTATSGDTGSAVAGGFRGVGGINVYILYPDGKVSDFQERQMTTLGGNIIPFRVKGTFDDCQRMVKEVFADTEYCLQHRITSANSINILRWLPQSFYYFYGYHLWVKQTGQNHPIVTVPSGNFGNITAGILAKRMGLPLGGFVAATNVNDVIPRFLQEGVYRPRPSVQTLANAMDVGAPSNYERLTTLYADLEEIRQDVKGYYYENGQIISAIRELYERFGYLSCPHSAIGYLAQKEDGRPGFYLSTAHASKFESVLHEAIGVTPAYPERMLYLFDRPKESRLIDPDVAILRNALRLER